MPDIHASFTNREVLGALRKAGWGHLLPADSDLENPDEVCVEFTTSTDDSSDDETDDDEKEESESFEDEDEEDEEEEESCEGGREDDEDEDEEAVEPEKFQQIWDSLDD